MDSDHVVARQIKGVSHTHILQLEPNLWELLEEVAEPALDGVLALEGTALGGVAG